MIQIINAKEPIQQKYCNTDLFVMRKIFLFGNHSNCHCGSKAVWQTLKDYLVKNKYFIVDSLDEADMVIINGEGSMHHNSRDCRIKLNMIETVASLGKNISLINTVWQDNSASNVGDKLKYISKIVTREVMSCKDLEQNHNIYSTVAPDIACFALNDSEKKEISNAKESSLHKNVAITDLYSHEFKCWVQLQGRFKQRYKMHILNNYQWFELIKSFAASKAVITGRHHAICACLLAKTPFVPIKSNSHKIEGLLLSANANIPIASTANQIENILSEVLEGKYNHEYEKCYQWLDSFTINDAIPLP